MAFGAAGSGLVILARYVLDGLGLDQNKDFQAIYLERAGDGPAMVMDGRAAALWGGGSGWPGFTAVAKGEKGARFIVPDKAEIARILAKHTFLKPLTLAAGMFPGQDKAIEFGGLVELRHGPPRPRRGGRLPPGQGRCTRARLRSPPSSPRPSRPRRATLPPPSPTRRCCIRACGAICGRRDC